MSKTVFCDMDETLLVNWHVPEINRKAIKSIREKGNRFVPCSGRPPFMMDEILKELELWNREGEYYVCLNGGMLLEAKNNKVVYYNGLTLDDTFKLMKIAEKYKFCVMVVTNCGFHIFYPLESEIRRKTNQGTTFKLYKDHDIQSVESLRNENISKVMFVGDHGVEGFKELAQKFPKEITDNYEIAFSSGRFMEFNKKGVCKGAAVRFLAEKLGINLEDCIAIGDSYNDISMMEIAGIGACVSSADLDVKKIADYVTEKDYMNGAVAEVLDRFIGI